MKTPSSLVSALKAQDAPLSAEQISAPIGPWVDLEARLVHALRARPPDPSLADMLDTVCVRPGGGAWLALERALCRARADYGALRIDGCLGFCPVTLVISASRHELPRFTPDLFVLPEPEALVRVLEAHGLANDYMAELDPQLYPAQQIAALPRAGLPALVRSLIDAVTLGKTCSGRDHPLLGTDPGGLERSLSVAGGRILGAFLLPVLYTGEAMHPLPAALTGSAFEARWDGFREAASRELTRSLSLPAPLRMEARVGLPRLLLSAVFDVTTAHCEATAYWAARAAVAKGASQARLRFEHAADGEGVVIGFDPGHEVEANFWALADTQEELDRYHRAFQRGAVAAGLRRFQLEVRAGTGVALPGASDAAFIAH